MKEKYDFDSNDTVKVKLNEFGMKFLMEQFEMLKADSELHQRFINYYLPDNDGCLTKKWSTFTCMFAPMLHFSSDKFPFASTIKIEEPKTEKKKKYVI